jgi:putative peptide zinc metalloprotease protein
MKGNIFSDDWYKISSLKLSIAYTANIHKQYFRGREWFVIHEPFNNKFFRVTPEAYRFLMALTPKKTVEEVWEEYLDLHPLDTPTQDEIIRLLSGLHRADLLYFKNRPKNEYIFDRYTQGEKQKLKEKLLSFLYLKIPLWDPEYWLRRSKPFIEILISKYSFLVWLVVLFFGLKSFVENYSEFSNQAQGVLSSSNLVYLYLSMAVLKFFHELGHAMMVKKFGGQVHTLGVMLVVFTPLPYMDASDSWAFRDKWHRILVGGAGMLVELFFAAIAAMVWANTGDGIVHSIAFNIMIIGSISSIFFNGNPLLKFDSYYMLSDYLEIPNLQKKSRDIWYYLVEKYLFGIKEVLSPSDTIKEGLLLSIYGVLSTFYRFLVTILA